MKPIDLPLNKHGRVDWPEFIRILRASGTVHLCEHEAKRTYNAGRYHGVNVTLKWLANGIISVTEAPERTTTKRGDENEIRNAEARHANLHNRIAEALQNANFWKQQIALRSHPDGIEQAIANHAAWKMTADRLTAEFHAKQQTAAA